MVSQQTSAGEAAVVVFAFRTLGARIIFTFIDVVAIGYAVSLVPLQTNAVDSIYGRHTEGILVANLTSLVAITSIRSPIGVSIDVVVSNRTDVAGIGHAVSIFVVIVVRIGAGIAVIRHAIAVLVQVVVAIRTHIVLVAHPIAVVVEASGIRLIISCVLQNRVL